MMWRIKQGLSNFFGQLMDVGQTPIKIICGLVTYIFAFFICWVVGSWLMYFTEKLISNFDWRMLLPPNIRF